MEIRNTRHQFVNNKTHGISWASAASSKASMIPEGNPTLHWTYCSLHGSVELAWKAKSPIRDLQELACVPPGNSFCQAPWGNFEFHLDMRVLATCQIKLKRKLQNKTLSKNPGAVSFLSFIFDMGPGLFWFPKLPCSGRVFVLCSKLCFNLLVTSG